MRLLEQQFVIAIVACYHFQREPTSQAFLIEPMYVVLKFPNKNGARASIMSNSTYLFSFQVKDTSSFSASTFSISSFRSLAVLRTPAENARNLFHCHDFAVSRVGNSVTVYTRWIRSHWQRVAIDDSPDASGDMISSKNENSRWVFGKDTRARPHSTRCRRRRSITWVPIIEQ